MDNGGKLTNESNTKEKDHKQAEPKQGLFGPKPQKEAPKKEAHEDKVKELTETLQRLQAEFENYQKRNSRQNDEFKTYANAKLIEELLPVLDSLEAGMQHSKDLAIIHEQIFGILKKNGLTKIKTEKGMNFDHDTMECLMQEQNPALKDNTVANVLINGYLLNGKILRLAKVSVNTINTKKENEEKKEEINKIEYEVKKMEE